MSNNQIKNVLIVDDDSVVRDMLKDFIEFQGLVVHTTENAMKALEVIKEKQFNLILTNYSMPGMNGDELVRIIKKDNPHIKIIGMSGLDNEGLFYKAGADFFIGKPIDLSRLKDLIETI